MPGLFLAIAVLATMAFAGRQVAALSEKRRLTAGTWALDVSFLTAPDPARFESVFRGASSGYQVNTISWSTPTRAAITVTVPPGDLAPVIIDVGTPSPNATFAITSAIQTAPALPGGSVPAVSGAARRAGRPLRGWSLSFETSTAVFDKPSFEDALTRKLDVRAVVRMKWQDSRNLSVVVLSRSDLRKHVGHTVIVRDVRTTLNEARPIQTGESS